jgi:hypothetical protein
MHPRSIIASFVSVFLLASQCLLVPAVHAAMVGTQTELARAERAEQEQQIVDTLSRDKARETLAEYGVEPEQIQQRLSRLTDAEVQKLAKRTENLPAGQDVLGFVLGVILILVLLDLLGATDVFPAVDPIN